MARITVEDCLDNVDNRFELVLTASLADNPSVKTTVSAMVEVPPFITSNTLDENIRVLPNPVDNHFVISQLAGATVSIYNIMGAEMERIEWYSSPTQIYVSRLAPGIYFLRINSGNTSGTLKIIKR